MSLPTGTLQKCNALIPARSGSKRIKDKNLQNIGGKSLIQWAVDVARECNMIERVVVSTESEHYAALATLWGAEVLMRPPELASDLATDEDVLGHFFEHFPCDLCVFLRPTTPFRDPALVEDAIRMMLNNRADSLRSVEEMGESAWKTFEIVGDYLDPIVGSMHQANLPNQILRKTYRGNGYVDILRGPKWGNRVLVYITPRVIEIDTPEDLEYARWWHQKKEAK